MMRVDVAELAANLSKLLRAVRRGERVTVLDRGLPIASLSPYEAPAVALPTRPARRPLQSIELLPPLRPAVGGAALLLEERGRRR